MDRALAWVEDILTKFPPALPEYPVRRASLIRLNDILHIESPPRKPLVRQSYRMQMENAVGQIGQTRITEGMRIRKLYNHGLLVRTAAVCLAFDFVPGVPEHDFLVDAALLEHPADQADALLLSHARAIMPGAKSPACYWNAASLWWCPSSFGKISRASRAGSCI